VASFLQSLSADDTNEEEEEPPIRTEYYESNQTGESKRKSGHLLDGCLVLLFVIFVLFVVPPLLHLRIKLWRTGSDEAEASDHFGIFNT